MSETYVAVLMGRHFSKPIRAIKNLLNCFDWLENVALQKHTPFWTLNRIGVTLNLVFRHQRRQRGSRTKWRN